MLLHLTRHASVKTNAPAFHGGRKRPPALDVLAPYAEVIERGLNRIINITDNIETPAPKIKLAAGLM